MFKKEFEEVKGFMVDAHGLALTILVGGALIAGFILGATTANLYSR